MTDSQLKRLYVLADMPKRTRKERDELDRLSALWYGEQDQDRERRLARAYAMAEIGYNEYL